MNNLNSIVDYLKVFNNINKRKAYEPRTMAQEPRNMYAGGQLVQNTADGSRPGYKGKQGLNVGDFNPGAQKVKEMSTEKLYTKYGKEYVDNAAKEWAKMSNKEKNRTRKMKIQNFDKMENAYDRGNFKVKFNDDIEKYGEWNIDRKITSRNKRVLREQGIQIDLIKETNKPGKFNAGKFADKYNLSMKELKEQATLLQNNIYDKRSLITGTMSKDSKSVLDWVPVEDIKTDTTLTKLSKSGLTDYIDNRISAKFYDAFGRKYIKGSTTELNPTRNLPKYKAIRKNKNEYESLRRLINKKYPSLNFQLDHPLSQRSINALMEGTAEELSKVNVLDQELNQNFKKQLSDKYFEAMDGKVNLEMKKSVEKIAKDLNINIGNVPDDLNVKGIKRGVQSFEKLNIKDEILKSLKNQQNLSTNFKSYLKDNPDVLKKAGFTDTSKLGTRLTKVTDKHIAGVEKILTQAGFNIDKCLSSGGRVKLQGGGGLNTCIRGVIEAEQKSAMKGNKISKAKFGKFGKFARTAGWFLGAWDVPIELAFALPHMLQGDREAAKRATTLGLVGWGEKKLDEIKADSPEAYKYAKHVKDNNDWVDAWFSEQDADQNLEVLKNVPERSQTEKRALYTNQKNTAINTMAQIQEGYVGYVDEEGRFDRMGGTKGKISLQDYLRENVKKKADAGFQIDIDLPFYQKKNVAGIAPFKGGQPITNVKQYIEQKNEPYWKSGLEHAAYEAGVPDLFDTFMQGADNKDPRDLYSELPLKYASQLGKMEAEETRRLLARKKAKEEADEAAERYGPYTRFAEGGIMNLKKNKW